MPEQLKPYIDRIKEFWNKYTNKQKTIFFAVLSAVVISIVILALVLARPQTMIIKYCSSTLEAVEVRDLLTASGIECEVNPDYSISIDPVNEVEAQLILGSNNLSSAGYTLDDALNGGFSSSEADKTKKYRSYLEDSFEKQLARIDGIKAAEVHVNFVDAGSTIFAEKQDAYINAILTTTKSLSQETVEGIGGLLANNVGSNNTHNVVIMDDKGQLLFSGTAFESGTSASSSVYKYKTQLETNLSNDIRTALIATGVYSEAKVLVNLKLDNDAVNQIVTEYNLPTGSDNGLYSSYYAVNSTGGYTAGGIAGAESNDDDTSYYNPDGGASTSEYSLENIQYLQNVTVTTTDKASGVIINEDSTISLIGYVFNYVTEDSLRTQGLLDDMTYEEYKLANSASTRLDVDVDMVTFIANAANIPFKNISFLAYQINVFEDEEPSAFSISSIIQIVLSVIILALIVFIVIRSSRPVSVEEQPSEDIDSLLAATREKENVDDIEYQDKSEERKAIEKFVTENPEAVALLLRNWLNEGWN